MTAEEALARAIARIPALEKGPLAVAIEVDQCGNATATIDYEMSKEQLLRLSAHCDELERKGRARQVRESRETTRRCRAKPSLEPGS